MNPFNTTMQAAGGNYTVADLIAALQAAVAQDPHVADFSVAVERDQTVDDARQIEVNHEAGWLYITDGSSLNV
jgi:hypothetical protein